jgi:BCD family chlorophyll transporter-like MFS transporter
MAIGNPSDLHSHPPYPVIPKLKIYRMFQIGLYQMGLGIMSVLTLGVLNRVMINELAIPALITAGAIAMHQFVSPARLWFGQMSDARPLGGQHRTGYVWLGTALFVLAAFLAVQVMWQLGDSLQASGWSGTTYGWVGLLGLVFAFYGLALSAGSTPFAALLVDISDEDDRSKLVSVVWSMLMVGIVIGAILSSRLLPQPVNSTCDALGTSDLNLLRGAVDRLFLVAPGIVLLLALFSIFGVEKKYSRFRSRSITVEREDQITFRRAWRVLTASRQTGLFFTFLLFMTLSLFMQDPVLESYGGKVFGMCVGDTTKLNAFSGTGTLVGIAATGFAVVPRIGKKNTARLGCLMVAVALLLVIAAGFTARPKFLQWGVMLFGLASGVTTTGAITLMLDLTAAETAGTFIGAWGLAQAMARAMATVLGGALLDLGEWLFSLPVLAYGLVFATQALGMVVAVGLLSRVDVQEFRTDAKDAIAAVIGNDLD